MKIIPLCAPVILLMIMLSTNRSMIQETQARAKVLDQLTQDTGDTRYLLEAIEIDPDNPQWHSNLADLYMVNADRWYWYIGTNHSRTAATLEPSPKYIYRHAVNLYMLHVYDLPYDKYEARQTWAKARENDYEELVRKDKLKP